jgi:hypothetical protein
MVANEATERRSTLGYYKEKSINYEETAALRAAAEKEKQESITILACTNTAVSILSQGLNIKDVEDLTERLLMHRDKLLYGDQDD